MSTQETKLNFSDVAEDVFEFENSLGIPEENRVVFYNLAFDMYMEKPGCSIEDVYTQHRQYMAQLTDEVVFYETNLKVSGENSLIEDTGQHPRVKGCDYRRDVQQVIDRYDTELLHRQIAEQKEVAQAMYTELAHNPALLIQHLALSMKFPDIAAESCLVLMGVRPDAKLLLTEKEYGKLGIHVKTGELPKAFPSLRKTTSITFERDGKAIPLEQASSAELKKIVTGKLPAIKQENLVPVRLYDITQTDCRKDRYETISQRPVITREKMMDCVEAIALVNGIEIIQAAISVEGVQGYYDDELHRIVLADNLTAENKGLVALECYCRALVESTSTEPALIRGYESKLLFMAVLETYDITKPPAITEEIETLEKAAFTGEKGFSVTKLLNRGVNECRYIGNLVTQHAPQPEPAAPRRRSPKIAQELSANFLKNL